VTTSSPQRCGWAEDAARELPGLSLGDALQLVHPYGEQGSPKYERAALRWLERYLTESSPRLQRFAEITASLAQLEALANGLRRPRARFWRPFCGR
jgi:hypothetical protein